MGRSSGGKSYNRMHPDDWSQEGSVGFLHPESDPTIDSRSDRTHLSSGWTKERSSQQVELDDMHRRPSSRDDDYDYDYDDAGCCSVGTDRAMSCLQVLDVSIGISLLVYGSLILRRGGGASATTTTRSFDASASEEEEEEDGAMAAISLCYIFGTVHLTTSALGLYSRHFVVGCRRCGMYASAVGGAYFAFAYFTVVVALLIDGTGFLTYLDEHKEVMYLKSNVYENAERMMPLIYAILIVLGSLEASRPFVLLGLRGRLVRLDAGGGGARGRTLPRSSSSSAANDGTLAEALLERQQPSGTNPFEDDGATTGGGGSVRGGGGARMETAETPEWWGKDMS